LSVLDLCCGKGGDLPYKWRQAKIAHYVGADLSKESIKSAKEKHEDMTHKISINLDKRRNDRFAEKAFPAIFIVQDAGDDNEQNLIDNILKKEKSLQSITSKIMFDIVSTQFAIHYMFESQTKLRAFLRNVTDRLEEDGVFIGTTVDADRVVCKIREAGSAKNLTVGNDYYSIVFGQDTFKKRDSAFGIKYYFYLLESVGKTAFTDGRPIYVPEYLVPFEALIEMALEYGLVLDKKMNFHEYYEKMS
jgi:mRNA (guanine-N7-)-methyltransferase